jgi:phospholipase/lecithinase/hemolysin
MIAWEFSAAIFVRSFGMITRHPFWKSFFALLIVCVLPSVALAQMPQFDSLYVFGDSLADNGNVLIQSRTLGVDPPVPPSASPHQAYFEGRFSNGYVEFEYLWKCLTGNALDGTAAMKPFLASPIIRGAGAIDFAYGGTGTDYLDQTPGGMWAPGLKGQIELFRLALHGRKPSDHALYAIATGANDYRVDPFNVPMDSKEVVANIEDGIVTLYKLGARNVVVLDMPDLGLIPASAGDPSQSAISRDHNKRLYKRMAALQSRLPALHLIVVKFDPLFQELLATMESHIPLMETVAPYEGMSACLFINPSSCLDGPALAFQSSWPFIFWDIIHPTTEAHHRLADYIYQQLDASY